MTIQTLPSSVKASTWLVGVSISGSRCLIRRDPGGAESGLARYGLGPGSRGRLKGQRTRLANRSLGELQDLLIRPAKDKTSRLRPARTPKRSDRRPQEHPGQEGPNHPSPTDILNRGAEELTREP